MGDLRISATARRVDTVPSSGTTPDNVYVVMHHNNIPWKPISGSQHKENESKMESLFTALQHKEKESRMEPSSELFFSSSLLSVAAACACLFVVSPSSSFPRCGLFIELITRHPLCSTISKKRFNQQLPTVVRTVYTKFSSSY